MSLISTNKLLKVIATALVGAARQIYEYSFEPPAFGVDDSPGRRYNDRYQRLVGTKGIDEVAAYIGIQRRHFSVVSAAGQASFDRANLFGDLVRRLRPIETARSMDKNTAYVVIRCTTSVARRIRSYTV
jgi:hypothetical protein